MDISELFGTENSVLAAIRSRRAIRAFLPDSVSRAQVDQILETAARAPSGSNVQPWQVIVVGDPTLSALGKELAARSIAGDVGEAEYTHYPQPLRDPYLTRRRQVGWALYGTLGIVRGDTERMAAQHARNFRFFDAPVGLFFTLDRDMELGSWLDLGMFVQNIMIAARGVGLDTCPQGAFAAYHRAIAEWLDIPADRQLVMGMALGYADRSAPENLFDTVREPVDIFTRYIDI